MGEPAAMRANAIEARRLLQADLGHWLGIRAVLRAQDAHLTAARYRAVDEAAAADEPLMTEFVARIEEERVATAALGTACDARIAELHAALAALDRASVSPPQP